MPTSEIKYFDEAEITVKSSDGEDGIVALNDSGVYDYV
jgi:hypothetical protein